MTKIIQLSLLTFLIFLSACSSGMKPRNVDQFYSSTGVAKYFLSDLPDWANFSQSAGCFRSKGIRYFDIDALMKSYSLKYTEALQIQATFNEELLQIKKDAKVNLTLKDEEVLFFKASEKVNSKINFFDAPAFKQIHLIWLDEALKGKKEEDRLRKFLSSSTHDAGFPVLVSACLTKSEIEAKFPGLSIKAISAEMFSIYDEAGINKPMMHINIDPFFKPDQKIIFYMQETKKTVDHIRGKYKTANY